MIDEEKNTGGPIFRLPADITIEIFTQAIQLDIDTLPDDTEDHILPLTPLDLGAVCRSWRSFVWETPSFWAVIVLKLRYEQYNNQIDILELWIQNSGTYPLTIWLDPRMPLQSNNFDDLFFHINDHSDNKPLDYGPSVVALRKLVDQSPRWKNFSTHVIYDQEFIDVLGQVKGRVPLLQSVCLNLQYDHTYGTKMDIFENAPLLKGFTVINLVSQLHDRVLLPWRQLTSFHGSCVDEEGCVKVLSLCTNLVECVLSDVIYTDEFESGKIISLPHLRSLTITKSNAGGIETILRYIRCPELCQLHLSEGAREFPIAEIEDFIRQSNCDLKALHLENLSKLSFVLPFIERLTSLQSLIVQCRSMECYYARRGSRTETWSMLTRELLICSHDTDQFFNSLLSKLDLTMTATSTFLPNLTELRCKIPLPHFPSSPPLPTSLYLLDVLQQRWNPPDGVARLQGVVLEDTLMLDESEDGNEIDGLTDLMRKGMKIIVPGL